MSRESDKELAKILLDMSKMCGTRVSLSYHLRMAGEKLWQGYGYKSNGSARVEEHLREFAKVITGATP